MAKHSFEQHIAVIDLETLAMGSDSPILSLGLTVSRWDTSFTTFDKLVNEGLYIKFDLKEQLKRGRKPAERVVKWWYDQSVEARKVLIPKDNDASLYDLPAILNQYFNKIGVSIKKVDFGDRNSFDLSKLQYLFENDLGLDVPWDYHKTFDIPSAFKFMGYDRYAGVHVSDFPGAIYHNALHDAAVDHMRMLKVMNAEGFITDDDDDIPY